MTIEDINKSSKRFSYLTTDGVLIGQFDLKNSDGSLSNIKVNKLKDWGDRFDNCLEWTFDQMSNLDQLVCYAIGPACATIIASMCAVGATEGMFETPDGP